MCDFFPKFHADAMLLCGLAGWTVPISKGNGQDPKGRVKHASRVSKNYFTSKIPHPLLVEILWRWALQVHFRGVGHSRETLGLGTSGRLWAWALRRIVGTGVGHSRKLGSSKKYGVGHSRDTLDGHSRDTLGLGPPGMSEE